MTSQNTRKALNIIVIYRDKLRPMTSVVPKLQRLELGGSDPHSALEASEMLNRVECIYHVYCMCMSVLLPCMYVYCMSAVPY